MNLNAFLKHRKADSGMSTVGDGLILMVAIVFSSILIFVGMSNYTNLVASDDITMISRQCIISMETKGYLSPEIKAETTAQLQQAGCENIDFHDSDSETGKKSTTQEVLFGKPITLHLTVGVPRRNVEVRGLTVVITNTHIPMDVVLTSTAKS